MKINLEYFQIQKWMLETIRAGKVDVKNGVIYLVYMFPSWVMVFKLSKKVQLNNHPWKKKIFFVEKNEAQISRAAVVKKALSPSFKKKPFQLICTDRTYKTVCGNVFKINGSPDIWLSLIFWFRETVFHHKIINKTRSTKN